MHPGTVAAAAAAAAASAAAAVAAIPVAASTHAANAVWGCAGVGSGDVVVHKALLLSSSSLPVLPPCRRCVGVALHIMLVGAGAGGVIRCAEQFVRGAGDHGQTRESVHGWLLVV